jgi:hypothetical protein
MKFTSAALQGAAAKAQADPKGQAGSATSSPWQKTRRGKTFPKAKSTPPAVHSIAWGRLDCRSRQISTICRASATERRPGRSASPRPSNASPTRSNSLQDLAGKDLTAKSAVQCSVRIPRTATFVCWWPFFVFVVILLFGII